ncbi:hypothetical protein [Extibacter muris]|uniref:hypothetical protein n=1 Tax=Extibacter muris TaxID=1796622 RepID=UPI001FAA61A1|nr:hypothetical protein [Extibacter muris]
MQGGKAATSWRIHKIFLVAAVLGLLALYFLTSRSVSYGRNRGALLCSLAGTLCLISGFAAHIPIGMAEGQGPYGYIKMMLNGKIFSSSCLRSFP